ncbi:MAG: family ATPase [Dehalococcoidia bacterium]|nr:family ATPase [Dehalococcoidia bacterium]
MNGGNPNESKPIALGRRIAILGPTGSGKSTTGASMAEKLGLAFIELDSIFWLPNWRSKNAEEFRKDLRIALDAAPQGWVVAGNYGSQSEGMVIAEADTIIWLRLPFRTTFRRVLIARAWTRQLLWGTNRESWRMSFFSRDSIILYSIHSRSTHIPKTESLLRCAPLTANVYSLRSPCEVSHLLEATGVAAPSFDRPIG